ncbi:rod shape-determining protein MreD [Candidatus Saganbacteria bacterium]|nr:rod shape-determining protein MreD [Candidatus Saganbacteria bacterium]
MRWLKLSLYLLGLVICQTVLLPQLIFFGVIPDVFLISIIVFTVIDHGVEPIFFAFLAGFFQDLSAVGPYFYTMSRTLVAGGAAMVRQSFLGDEQALILALVAFLTPLLLVGQIILFGIGGEISRSPVAFSFKIIAATIYNLFLAPLILFLLRRMLNEE